MRDDDSRAVSVLLVDDSVEFLRAAARLLECHAALAVVGRATSGDEALAMVERLRPDAPGRSSLPAGRRRGRADAFVGKVDLSTALVPALVASMRIKRRLVLLVVSVLAPMVTFAIMTVVMLVRQERATQDRGLLEIVT